MNLLAVNPVSTASSAQPVVVQPANEVPTEQHWPEGGEPDWTEQEPEAQAPASLPELPLTVPEPETALPSVLNPILELLLAATRQPATLLTEPALKAPDAGAEHPVSAASLPPLPVGDSAAPSAKSGFVSGPVTDVLSARTATIQVAGSVPTETAVLPTAAVAASAWPDVQRPAPVNTSSVSMVTAAAEAGLQAVVSRVDSVPVLPAAAQVVTTAASAELLQRMTPVQLVAPATEHLSPAGPNQSLPPVGSASQWVAAAQGVLFSQSPAFAAKTAAGMSQPVLVSAGLTPEATEPAEFSTGQLVPARLNTVQTDAVWRSEPLLGSHPSQLGQRLMHLLADKTELQFGLGLQKATIRLDPPSLGAVELSIAVDGDKVSVQLNSSVSQTRELMAQGLDQLRLQLQQKLGADIQLQLQTGDGQSGQRQRQWGSDTEIAQNPHWVDAEPQTSEQQPSGWLNQLV